MDSIDMDQFHGVDRIEYIRRLIDPVRIIDTSQGDHKVLAASTMRANAKIHFMGSPDSLAIDLYIAG